MKLSQILTCTIWFSIIILGFSCKKVKPSNAIITGIDRSMALCLGGYIITFNGKTNPKWGEYKEIANPQDIDLGNNTNFPIYLNVICDTLPQCNNLYVKIKSFSRIK